VIAMPGRSILDLTEPAARERTVSGSKAAVLATLLQAGFPVPDGCVITTEAFSAAADGESHPGNPEIPWAAVREVAERYDGIAVAVRSSGLAEDLPDASFAGLYESVLDVRGLDDLADAVRRCRASAEGAEVRGYRVGGAGHHDVAVLVQRLIWPSVAGVAFGADPMTGNRATVLVSAVRGSGAALVAGLAEGEDWEVTSQAASCRRDVGVLRPGEARSVANLLRQIEGLLGGPLDMEWALADGTLWVLQARPMTVVPPVVSWAAPLRGGWFRGIRLGEWLPEPVTPLCDTWLLARMEDQLRLRQEVEGGIKAPPPLHVLVEGWYFHSPIGTGGSALLLAGLARRPRLGVATVIGTRRPVLADRLYFGARARNWRSAVLEPYQLQVGNAWLQVEQATTAELVNTVNQVADAAGDFLWSLVTLGGAAWRSEVALARFHHRHLSSAGVPYQALLGGLAPPLTLSHAVQSLDWFRQTLAELTADDAPLRVSERLEKVAADRVAAEQSCRDVLATAPRRRIARFESLLDVARRHAVIRWELSDSFTLPWPLLRRCVQRLGEAVCADGQLAHPDDLFFLTFAELEACLAAAPPPGLAETIQRRRATWERQRQLIAPLTIGRPPFLFSRFLLSMPKFLRAALQADGDNLRGIPASPGVATGPVRVMRDGTSAGAVKRGDVLVVPAVVPALTPLFSRIAAICADSGSVAAHTSIVAREYGIPSVTGLGDATKQLTDGILVTVDGSAGRVVVR
jgi:phosphohistidine swiveling domain-containing protein